LRSIKGSDALVQRARVDAFTIARLGRGVPRDVDSYSIDTRTLRRLFKEQGSDLLGKPVSGPSSLQFELDIGDVTLSTVIDLRRSLPQVAFMQRLQLRDDPGPMPDALSNPMAWHGMAFHGRPAGINCLRAKRRMRCSKFWSFVAASCPFSRTSWSARVKTRTMPFK
jgi:hypothetical protein